MAFALLAAPSLELLHCSHYIDRLGWPLQQLISPLEAL